MEAIDFKRAPKKKDLYLGQDDNLLRLLFSNRDYFNGNVKDLAISLDDLEERGFSLDIERISSRKIVRDRADEQMARAKNPEEKEKSYIARFSNSAISAELDLQENKLFTTVYSPMHGNYAHASLLCHAGKGKGRSYYVRARAKLKEHLQGDITPIDLFPFNH